VWIFHAVLLMMSIDDLPPFLQTLAARMTPQAPDEVSQLSSPHHWNVAIGTAGWTLFFSRMACLFPTIEWNESIDRYLAQTLLFFEAEERISSVPLGLFTGLTGLCLVVDYLATSSCEYQPLQAYLRALLFRHVLEKYQKEAVSTLYQGVTFHDYDVISGPSGIGAYALLHQDHPDAQPVLNLLIERFLFLAQPHPCVMGHLRFYIPPERSPHATFLKQMPEGATDLGFAHGVAGPLAFLSLAALRGMRFPGLHQAISQIGLWLIAARYEDHQRISWVSALPKNLCQPLVGRPAWCYGTPGVAWALWLAGRALRHQSWQDLAIAAMASVAHAIFHEQKLAGPILCHGLSGVIIVLKGFLACGASIPSLVLLQERCIQHLLYLLASTCNERDLIHGRSPMTASELLEGMPGIGLALLSIASNQRTSDPLFPFLLLADETLLCQEVFSEVP
jgi:lantibiotic biosynthesis protein